MISKILLVGNKRSKEKMVYSGKKEKMVFEACRPVVFEFQSIFVSHKNDHIGT